MNTDDNSPLVGEIDDEWARAMAAAELRARAAGRGDVIEYLALRAANDLAREVGSRWLFDACRAIAGEANRLGAGIKLIETEGHRFATGSSTMTGKLVTLQMGIRSLSIAAGWPRAPRDGIVRGGGLASGQIKHFGRSTFDEELVLVRSPQGVPHWFATDRKGTRRPLTQARLGMHFTEFLASAR